MLSSILQNLHVWIRVRVIVNGPLLPQSDPHPNASSPGYSVLCALTENLLTNACFSGKLLLIQQEPTSQETSSHP
jgi:hypothetical protein